MMPKLSDFMIPTYDLINYRWNVYSQFGEDGILAKLINDVLGEDFKYGMCVECGAWDGIQYSNTRALYSKGWRSIQIEADKQKFEALRRAIAPYPEVVGVNARVSLEGDYRMDKLIDTFMMYPFVDVDVMVLDVDGDEYHIFKSMETIKPKILMVEVNPTFSLNVEFVQKPGDRIGSSALSMCLLAAEKGYKLVCYNTVNCIFLRKDLYERVNLAHKRYTDLVLLGSYESTHLSKDYDGRHYAYGYWPIDNIPLYKLDELKGRAEGFAIYTDNIMEVLAKIDR